MQAEGMQEALEHIHHEQHAERRRRPHRDSNEGAEKRRNNSIVSGVYYLR